MKQSKTREWLLLGGLATDLEVLQEWAGRREPEKLLRETALCFGCFND